MKVRFVLGSEGRRPLVRALGEALGAAPRYMGAPGFGYMAGGCIVDRDGALEIPEDMDHAELLKRLEKMGFVQEREQNPQTVSIPVEGFGRSAAENLKRLIEAKAELIRMALQPDSLAFRVEGGYVRFDWFGPGITPVELAAYSRFLSALCKAAKEQRRVTAKRAPVVNAKYEMRCFLLKLRYIGPEYKEDRAILLSRLPGNPSFKNSR